MVPGERSPVRPARLADRFPPFGSGRMQLLQFISCIRSLHCNVTDADIHSIIRLFDTSSKNFQEVDYKKFAKCFSPVTQFVTVHTSALSRTGIERGANLTSGRPFPQ